LALELHPREAHALPAPVIDAVAQVGRRFAFAA
jgi:hypothetical protein